MTQLTPTFKNLLMSPTGVLPLGMSVVALALVVSHVMIFGVDPRPTDEGAVAHLWQLLMVGQTPILAFFAIKWLARAPRPALGVLALQTAAILAAMAPVFLLKL